MAGLSGALVVMFIALSFVPLTLKGAVQKLLMFGIVVWFVAVAAML
jgi:hypothetical protein